MVEIGMPILALNETWSRKRVQHHFHQYINRKSSGMDAKFIDETVAAHNHYRSRHQAPQLVHSRELSQVAQKWADHLAYSGSFQHSNNTYRGGPLGENIALKWSSRADAYTGQEVTDQWYSEVKMYRFGGEPRSNNAGHFSQVVWKSSRDIGVGKATTKDGKIIVVANYYPAGNMMGEYSPNVLPSKTGDISVKESKPAKPPNPSSSLSTNNWGSDFSNNNTTNTRMFETQRRVDDFDDMRSKFFGCQPSAGRTSSSGESRSTRTYTVTEGHGPNKVTKIIEEETIRKANGEVVTNRKETVKRGGDDNPLSSRGFERTKPGKDDFVDFGRRLNLSDRNDQGIERKSLPSSRNDSQPQTMSDFIQGVLLEHNKVRTKHGVPALRHNPDLSANAQRWAESLASSGRFQHSDCKFKGERIGENIACKWSSGGGDYSSKDVVDQWYSEIDKHDFNSERSLGSGHFTQVVWKASKELGVGKAKAAGGKVIVVANYKPVGNVMGEFRANVFRPR